jgi:oxygen-independent coproporphyrinogen-3 oxidase
MEQWIPAYTDALCREMELVAASAAEPIPAYTLFFGGGTPSLLPLQQVEQILTTAAKCFPFQENFELSLEANPGSVNLDYLRGLKGLGVNRLSLGMQSAHPQELKLLTRLHDYPDVVRAVSWARQAGIDNLSLDLIFGLPGQSLRRWAETMDLALGLGSEHISLYSLIVEEDTPLYSWAARGLVDLPDNDSSADMYELAMDRLGAAGLVQYEISNWAHPRADGDMYACRHNLQYWRGLPYLGLGAGAHGYADGWRTANTEPILAYIRQINEGGSLPFPRGPANRDAHALEEMEEQGDFMMVGLRLTDEGVSSRVFEERFGLPLEQAYAEPIAYLTEAGLLEWMGKDEPRLRLTRRGRMLGNQVFMRFI